MLPCRCAPVDVHSLKRSANAGHVSRPMRFVPHRIPRGLLPPDGACEIGQVFAGAASRSLDGAQRNPGLRGNPLIHRQPVRLYPDSASAPSGLRVCRGEFLLSLMRPVRNVCAAACKPPIDSESPNVLKRSANAGHVSRSMRFVPHRIPRGLSPYIPSRLTRRPVSIGIPESGPLPAGSSPPTAGEPSPAKGGAPGS
jgi:hypothetical protein